jgi:ethanolamine utilization protein EutJ
VIAVARDVDSYLAEAASRADRPLRDPTGPIRFGVDLGTATVVLVAVDADDRPVHIDAVRREVVRDGVVVDFHGAVEAVRELRDRASAVLGFPPESAATAYPPGVSEADARACRFVLDAADVDCRALVDEVSAAQMLLELPDGVVADVGGGSTGVGTYVAGQLKSLGDLPGGGHQLNLILAGALNIEIRAAEQLKREGGSAHLAVLRPGIERIAHNIGRLIPPGTDGPIHLVGGALMTDGAGRVVASYLGRPVIEHPHPLLVTPLGIALTH